MLLIPCSDIFRKFSLIFCEYSNLMVKMQSFCLRCFRQVTLTSSWGTRASIFLQGRLSVHKTFFFFHSLSNPFSLSLTHTNALCLVKVKPIFHTFSVQFPFALHTLLKSYDSFPRPFFI